MVLCISRNGKFGNILILEGSNALKVMRKIFKIKLKAQHEDGIKILQTGCIALPVTADTLFGATR